ncbi:MAG: protein-glutamate O-methyltransferase CheR [Leptospiraceae bacterium]|nr:protein-glutamate O-methyltransferase CheR [Leptospiraceae bacterium]
MVTIADPEFNYLRDIIYKQTGISLADHKKIMLQSRLNIRLRAHHYNNFKDYVTKLKTDKIFFDKEILEIINRVTTNKTDFFRENHHFEYLKKTFLPALEERLKNIPRKSLKIWCSASSTGEEPYSIAITLFEYFAGKPGWDLKIIASDIDTNVLATAEKGIYKKDRIGPINPTLINKYFTEKPNANKEIEYQVKPILKSIINFKKINLLDSSYPIAEKMDIIFCRNVIIYFDKPTQKKIFAQMENILDDHGLLVIGHSETLFGISDTFKFIGHTIYQKKIALK